MYVIYKIIHRLTHLHVPSIFTTALLVSNYLVWLYGIVPEVFALHILLMSILIYISILLLLLNQKPTYLYIAALTFGLGISTSSFNYSDGTLITLSSCYIMEKISLTIKNYFISYLLDWRGSFRICGFLCRLYHSTRHLVKPNHVAEY